jgi:hypothetical protein
MSTGTHNYDPHTQILFFPAEVFAFEAVPALPGMQGFCMPQWSALRIPKGKVTSWHALDYAEVTEAAYPIAPRPNAKWQRQTSWQSAGGITSRWVVRLPLCPHSGLHPETLPCEFTQ